MNNKLITALRMTAAALENGSFNYDWNKIEQCNCGSLYCSLSGVSVSELAARLAGKFEKYRSFVTRNATWTALAGYYCPIAGEPTNEIFKELASYGLSAKEITELEYLSNKKVLIRVRETQVKDISLLREIYEYIFGAPEYDKLDKEDPADVALYMRAWADILTEQGQDDVPAAKQVTDETYSIPGR